MQQERSLRSRRALIEAAEGLWSEWGFDAAKVSDICEHAGVSKGLFYFYFASKEDLLVEFVLSDADEVAEAVQRSIKADEPVETVLQKGLAVMARRAQSRPRHLLARGIAEWFAALERHAALAAGHTTLQESFRAALEHGQRRGEIEERHSAAELGGLLEWALLRAELEWATSVSRQPALMKRLWSRVELVLRGAGHDRA